MDGTRTEEDIETDFERRNEQALLDHEEKRVGIETDFERRNEQALLDHEEKRVGIETDFERRNEQAKGDHARKLEDIDLAYNNSVERIVVAGGDKVQERLDAAAGA